MPSAPIRSDRSLLNEPLPVTVTLDVPEDAIEPFSFVVHAYEDVTRNVAAADQVSGAVVPGATVLSLRITPDPVLLYHFSTTESLFVYGLYDDGAVSVFDLNLMLGAWGVCEDPCPPSCPADLTNDEGMGGDCLVDTFDVLELLADWTG